MDNFYNAPKMFVRPPMQRKPSVLPKGPRMFTPKKSDPKLGGPGLPPPGFESATTSISEWIWYWASMKALDPDQDPRKPPFYGGRLWGYQVSQLGEYTRQLGSAVVDFVYELSYPPLMVRLQTWRFHIAAHADKQAKDRFQLLQLNAQFDVIDIYEQDFIHDASGQTAIKAVKSMLGLIRSQDPLTGGTARMVRSAIAR